MSITRNELDDLNTFITAITTATEETGVTIVGDIRTTSGDDSLHIFWNDDDGGYELVV